MAIMRMTKVLIISHHTQASELLEALQKEGICHILKAEEAMVSRDWPELSAGAERPRDIEEMLNRLAKSIAFLKSYAEPKKGLAGVFSPLAVINEQSYNKVASDQGVLKIIEQCEQTEANIEKAKSRCEHLLASLEKLEPWALLETPVEEIGELRQTICLAGLIPSRVFEQAAEELDKIGAAIQQSGISDSRSACLVICLKENIGETQKLLRSMDFEPVNFEMMTGTAAELIRQDNEKLDETKKQLQMLYNKAAVLAKELLKLEILYDHYENLLNREQTKSNSPATGQTVILEGWVKEKNYSRLEKIVSRFGASSLNRIEPAEGEEIPVDIENKNIIRPFEVITRLYGMPQHLGTDPTVFLAPFFALFFGICLGDAGYGLAVIAAAALLIKKLQGDTKLLWMLGICAVFAVIFGALTGGWFGDAVQQFVPALEPVRKKMMWFDPLEKPMIIFGLSMALGYIHIMTGLLIAFGHNIKQKDYIAAIFDQLTWLVMLNSIVLFGFGKAGVVPAEIGKVCIRLVPVPAVLIFLFSSREGGWGARLGMGAYNLFSSVFYMGDVLSYLRLMALGMVGAGLAMAINLIAKMTLKIPYGLGILAMILIFVIGHGFNLVLSVLGAFVHTMRLQFVEFFPKFLSGSGKLFEPLHKEYKHIYMEN